MIKLYSFICKQNVLKTEVSPGKVSLSLLLLLFVKRSGAITGAVALPLGLILCYIDFGYTCNHCVWNRIITRTRFSISSYLAALLFCWKSGTEIFWSQKYQLDIWKIALLKTFIWIIVKTKRGAQTFYRPIYIMSRVDGLSFWSKPDLLQRHKTSTNKHISIYRKREGRGVKGRIQKEAGK